MYVRIEYEKLLNITKFCSKPAQAGDGPDTKAVILTTDPDGLEVESLAADMWGRANSACEVITQGQIAVGGKYLADVIAALPVEMDSIVELADSGSELEIVAGGSRHRRQLPLIALRDYSGRPRWQTETSVVAPDICEQIMLTSKAAADNAKPNLAGVHLYPGGICATDSFKFMMIDTPMDLEPVTIPTLIIDKFPDPNSFGAGEIEMGSHNHNVLFRFGQNHDLTGATIMGEYPKPELIRGMIPDEDTPHYMEISLVHLKAVTEGLKPFAGSFSPVTLYPDGSLTIIAADGSIASDRLEVVSCELDRPVKFLLTYLNEVKSVMKGEETCMFRFNADMPDARPFVIQKDNTTIGMMPLVGN